MARHRRDGAHGGQTAYASAAIQAHEQGFSLIVSMMGRGDSLEALRFSPFAQCGVARRPRPFLQRGASFQIYGQCGVGNSAPCTKCCHGSRLAHAFAAQAVINRGGKNGAGRNRRRQQEQSKTVRSARNGYPYWCTAGPDCDPIGRKALP